MHYVSAVQMVSNKFLFQGSNRQYVYMQFVSNVTTLKHKLNLFQELFYNYYCLPLHSSVPDCQQFQLYQQVPRYYSLLLWLAQKIPQPTYINHAFDSKLTPMFKATNNIISRIQQPTIVVHFQGNVIRDAVRIADTLPNFVVVFISNQNTHRKSA